MWVAPKVSSAAPSLGGPGGPFPAAPLADLSERRWLHYAFFSRDHRWSLVANIAWLGAEGASGTGLRTAVLLLHDQERGWACSQWNAHVGAPPWSAFACDAPDAQAKSGDRLELAAAKGAPAVSLALQRTSSPCAAQTATFAGNHWMRWQSEPGALARGTWRMAGEEAIELDAVGYHERVRGCWGWREMGGWVFGFCNVLGGDPEAPPPWALVFTLLQPFGEPENYAASLMIWKRGRLVRHIPRRALRVSVAGQLDRDRVATAPGMAQLFGTPAMAPVPVVLCIDGVQGSDWVHMRFVASTAARLVIPSESSDRPYSVHEVIGRMEARLCLDGAAFTFEGPGVVEFAGGAAESS